MNRDVTRVLLFVSTCCSLAVSLALGRMPAPQEAPKAAANDAAKGGAASWDAAFQNPNTRYVRDVNAFVSYVTARIARENLCPGKQALDIAAGEGRNAIFLAQSGFSVTALDISKVALDHAQEQAKAKAVTITTVLADVFTHDYGVAQFDLVTVVYFNPVLRVLDKVKAAVKPGGLILIEGQGKEHHGGGPPEWSRFAPNQLLQSFADWRVLEYEDGIFPCDWNDGKPTPVVRIVARKPEAAAEPGK